MTPARLYGRGFSFPFQVQDGRIAMSEGETNIHDNIRHILLTEPGERLFLSGFGGGLNGFLFSPNTVATHTLLAERVRMALAVWEPRIRVSAVEIEVDPSDREAAVITLTYTLVATAMPDSMSVGVRLGA